MDRHFIYHSMRNRGHFCGKCGKRLTPDFYNSKKHAEACGFKVIESLPNRGVVTDDSAGYRLEVCKGNLLLEICQPELVPRPGFSDRFKGMRWFTVFRMVFSPDSREPRVTKNETGLDADIWLALIRAGRCFHIREETDVEIIREVFPGIIRLYSLQMFVHIYRTKGFHHEHLLRESMAQRLMGVDSESGGTVPAHSENGYEVREENQVRPVRLRRYWRRRPRRTAPIQHMIISLLKYKDSSLLLRIITFIGEDEPVAFLFSRGYAACTPNADIPLLLRQHYSLTSEGDKAVRRFARFYPEYNLEQYMEHSHNILVPLIAPDYHCLMELAAKASVPSVAENMEILDCFRNDPSLFRNLRDTFRLPLHVLRALDPQDVTDELLANLAHINQCHPGLLQFDHYTPLMCDFYHALSIEMVPGQTGRVPDRRRPIRNYRIHGLYKYDLTDDQILQILRFLRKSSDDANTLRYLFDYINACEHLGEYPYGFIPRGSLRIAHDRIVQRIRLDKNDKESHDFHSVVTSAYYLSLTTDRTEEDREFFKEDPFVIIAPEEREDLFLESDAMHNCVRIYVNAVCAGRTKIYFLRRKRTPGTSFGTIEVRGNTLVQAKAHSNGQLDQAAQDYIRKWCHAKNLRILTLDIVSAS